EVPVLIERGAGGRKQHHGFIGGRGGSVPCRGNKRFIERSGGLGGGDTRQRVRELIGGLTGPIGLAGSREKSAQAFDAARLRPPSRDPENVVETGQRLGRRIGVGGFGIIDEKYGAAPTHLLHPVRQSWKRSQSRLDRRPIKAERECGGCRAGAVLGIVRA